MFSHRTPKRILAILALSMLALCTPGMTATADAADQPWEEDQGVVMGGGTSELEARIAECLKLRDGDPESDAWFPIGLKAKFDVARGTSEFSPLGMLLRLDFIMDARLAQWDALGCSDVLGNL